MRKWKSGAGVTTGASTSHRVTIIERIKMSSDTRSLHRLKPFWPVWTKKQKDGIWKYVTKRFSGNLSRQSWETLYMYCGWELIREVISVDANICCKRRPSHFIFRPLPYIFGLFSLHPEFMNPESKYCTKRHSNIYMDIVWQHKGLLICWHSVVQIII